MAKLGLTLEQLPVMESRFFQQRLSILELDDEDPVDMDTYEIVDDRKCKNESPQEISVGPSSEKFPLPTPARKSPGNPKSPIKKVHFQLPAEPPRKCSSASRRSSRDTIPRPTKLTADIGIYMDEKSVLVGEFNLESEDVDVLRHCPAEMAFVDDGVYIGLEAEAFRHSRNHFYVYELLKKKSSLIHSVELSVGRHPISTRGIQAAFFKALGKEIMDITRTISLGKVVLTVPFVTTSTEKKRLVTALSDAGFLSPRILSTVLSTAIAFTKDYNYYRRRLEQSKLVFVAQCLPHSFCTGIVEISPGSICTRSVFSSANMPECQDGIFQNLNEKLHNNQSVEDGKLEFMLKVYQKAVHQLCVNFSASQLENKFNGYLIVKSSVKSTKLDCLFRDIFGEDLTTAPDLARGPLLGAALLAAKSQLLLSPNPLLPEDLQVFDASPANLIFSLNDAVTNPNQKTRVLVQNVAFVPRQIVREEITIPPGGTCVLLTEEYSEFGYAVEVSKCFVPQGKTFFRTRKKSAETMVLSISVDENGVYVIHVYPEQKYFEYGSRRGKF